MTKQGLFKWAVRAGLTAGVVYLFSTTIGVFIGVFIGILFFRFLIKLFLLTLYWAAMIAIVLFVLMAVIAL